MAETDGNPGRNNPRDIEHRRRSKTPISDDTDGELDLNAEHGRQSGGDAVDDTNLPPDIAEPQGLDFVEEDEDSGASAPGNFLGEDGLEEAAEPTLTPESDAFWEEETQLSSPKGVPHGMGTIALERIPLDEQSARLAASGRSGALAGDLFQMTDAEIMQRAGAGDEACLEFLIAKYRRPIISFMYRMVHNQAVAEELAQEVFLRVYRARATYRAEARFSTWLYRIASNMAINYARDTKYERASSSIFLDQADDDTGSKPDVADLRPLAEQDILQDERMRRIREHVMALPERQRMAVVMHKYQDMDYKQIGAVLKLSESATKSLLFRAYQTLREKLKEFA
ncbi:MAG: RNA polymerase sigma factor [Acidobacteriaceae bacterium]